MYITSLDLFTLFYFQLFPLWVTLIGVMARTSPGAPPPPSPLPSTETSTLSSSHAASGGPQLPADPGRLSHRRGRSCGSGDDAGKAPSDLSCHRLLVIVLSLNGQDRCNVIVGSRCEVHLVILPPYRESSAAHDASQVLTAVEAAERVESCDGEAVLLSFGLEDIEAGRAAARYLKK